MCNNAQMKDDKVIGLPTEGALLTASCMVRKTLLVTPDSHCLYCSWVTIACVTSISGLESGPSVRRKNGWEFTLENEL